MSAKLSIVKSESEKSFIHNLMSEQKVWVWLGMERKQGKMVWFDDTPAEPSNRALYSSWRANKPSNKENGDCAYVVFYTRGWNDNKCVYTNEPAPFVLCQKALV